MTLFDLGPRSQSAPANPTESYYEFLNRAAGEFWEDVRNEMERWCSGLPASAREGIRSRMRGDDAGFWSTYWELFLRQMFIELGWQVEFEPEIEDGAIPDLYIANSDEEYLVEATVLMEPKPDARSEVRRGPLMESLSQVSTQDFWLGLEIEAEGEQQPSGRRLAKEIQDWVDGLTYSPPRHQTSAGAPPEVQEKTFVDRGWRIRVRGLPKSEGHRRVTSGIQMGPGRSRWVNDHLAMTNDLKQKARRYRSAGTPLILAVMNHRWTASPETAPLALYGVAWEHPRMMAAGRIDPTWRNVPEGLWITRAGRRYHNVMAVITSDHLTPHSFPDDQISIWHPPTSMGALATLSLAHMTPQPDGTLRESEASESIRGIFGLPANWPTGQPFPSKALGD